MLRILNNNLNYIITNIILKIFSCIRYKTLRRMMLAVELGNDKIKTE